MKSITMKIIGVITALSLITALSSGCVTANNTAETNAAATISSGITVTYDGETVEFDVEPAVINDRVMVPMRAIFELFGAKVKWDGDTETITAKRRSKTITMTIGSTEMTKNDETYTFDVSPMIVDGRTLVPIRAISELLGLEVDWNEETRTVTITSDSDEDESWKENTGTIDLDSMTVTGDGISVTDKVITITEGGDFTVTGESDDAQIVIDTEDKAKLRLSGMSLTNTTGSAIYIKNADKAYITLTEGTENYIADGESYTSGDEKEKGAITARDTLEIKGKGSLTISGNYKNGIDASDSLIIENGNITISAVNDGINVNDTLEINGGTLDVTAESDGIQAGDIIDITDGTVNVTTTGEVQASSNNEFGFGGRGMMQTTTAEASTEDDSSEDVTSKGIKADWLIDISGGSVTVNSTDHAIHCASDIEISGGEMTLASDKKKGISAHGDVTIDGGTINITKSTEGIEAKAIMTINDGDISIVASDDGLNAGGGSDSFGGGMGGMMRDRESWSENSANDGSAASDEIGGQRGFGGRGGMTPPDMENGEMPSGMQGMTRPDMSGEMPSDMGGMTPPDMNGGETTNGGFGGGMGGMMGGKDTGEISSEHHIQINGGSLYIECQGDGIDSNGSLQIDGGTVIVNSPATGSETSFDADSTIIFNGGTIIGIGCAGTGETPGSYSTQNVIIAYTTSSFSAGDKITVTNSSGKTIAETTSAKGGSMVTVSTPEIKTGETYTVTVGSEELTATVDGVITTVGTKSSGMGFGGGMGGGRSMQEGEMPSDMNGSTGMNGNMQQGGMGGRGGRGGRGGMQQGSGNMQIS